MLLLHLIAAAGDHDASADELIGIKYFSRPGHSSTFTGVDHLSLAGGAELIIKGLGFHHRPESHQLVFTIKGTSHVFYGQLTQNNAFNSNPHGGLL